MFSKLQNPSIWTTSRCPTPFFPGRGISIGLLVTLGACAMTGQQPLVRPARSATALTLIAAGVQTASVPSRTVVTLTAAVTADGSPVPTGQVSFCNATAPLCTDVNRLGIAQLTAAGTATFSFVPGSGGHSYTAVFGGNANDSASTSPPQSLSVNAASGLTDPATSAEFQPDLKANATGALGASNLSLTPGATYPTGQLPSATVTADFNGDGILDLAVTILNSPDTYVPGNVIILLGKGDGTFTAAPTLVTDIFPSALVTADFNGDGKIDLAFSDGTDGSISILLGNGDGTFTPAATIFGSFGNNGALAVGDFNGDGIQDLAVSQTIANTVRILLGNGNGTFTQVSETPATGDNPVGMAVGDFNHDGHLDLAVTNVFPQPGSDTPSSVTILLGTGEGTFTTAPAIPVGVGPEQVLTADFNGDGKLDLAVLNIGLPTTISMLFGNGDGTFNSTSPQIPLPYLSSLALGDFNGDGKPDIGGFLEVYQPTNVNQNVYALINNGDGTFASITASDSGIPQNGDAGDFNGDGLSDLAVAGEYGGVSIYLTTIDGLAATTTSLTCTPSTLSLDATSLFSATVTSSTGTPTGAINFTDNGSTLSQQTLVNGDASYTYTGQTAGAHTILATYVPTGSFGASSASCSVTVNALNPAITLTSSLNPAPALTPITFTAQLPANTGGSVIFSINGQNISTTPNANGTATTTISTLTAGTYPITATWFASNSALSAQASLTQVVTPPLAVPDFSFTGTNISFKVLQSGTGNLQLASLNNFSGNIALTCNPPYPANYTCTLQSPSINLASGGTSTVGFTLNYTETASAHTRSSIVLAALFPLSLVSLMGLGRKRRATLRALLSLALLAILATATTACGPDHYIPITTGTFPITFTATGTSQGTTTSITHTVTINATIAP